MRKFSLRGDEMSEVPWLMIELDTAWIIFDFQSKSWIYFCIWYEKVYSFNFYVQLWKYLIKCGPVEMVMRNHTCILATTTPWTVQKNQKDMTPEDESPRSEGVLYATGEEQKAITNNSKRMMQLDQSRNDNQLWMYLVVKVKSSAVKSNIA